MMSSVAQSAIYWTPLGGSTNAGIIINGHKRFGDFEFSRLLFVLWSKYFSRYKLIALELVRNCVDSFEHFFAPKAGLAKISYVRATPIAVRGS